MIIAYSNRIHMHRVYTLYCTGHSYDCKLLKLVCVIFFLRVACVHIGYDTKLTSMLYIYMYIVKQTCNHNYCS